MKKIIWIILILFCIFGGMPVEAVTIKGGVAYTVEEARREAFDGVRYTIPLKEFKEHLKDPNYKSNRLAIENGVKDMGDRWVEWFSDGEYIITYKSDRYRAYCYKSNGELEEYCIWSCLDFPSKTYKYDIKGNLISVAFHNTSNDIYIYKVDGTYEGRYVGDKFYDENGKYKFKRIK